MEAAVHLAILLGWLRGVLPDDFTVLLRALLPDAELAVAPLDGAYAAVAQQAGVSFLRCAQDIDLHNERILYDGTHPTLQGQRVLMDRVAPAVRALHPLQRQPSALKLGLGCKHCCQNVEAFINVH